MLYRNLIPGRLSQLENYDLDKEFSLTNLLTPGLSNINYINIKYFLAFLPLTPKTYLKLLKYIYTFFQMKMFVIIYIALSLIFIIIGP